MLWYYNIADHKGRIVVLGSDLSTKEWQDEDLDELVPGDGNYSGAWENDEEASGHVSKKDDFYYETTHADLRVATAYVPGSIIWAYELLRILNADDLQHLNEVIQTLTNRVTVGEYTQELGSQFELVQVGTPTAYTRELTAHKNVDGGDRSYRILVMQITADIAGNYQALGDQTAQPYSWKAGDVLVAAPVRDDVIKWPASPGTGEGGEVTTCLLYTSPSPRDS